jgi:hypothetical protein
MVLCGGIEALCFAQVARPAQSHFQKDKYMTDLADLKEIKLSELKRRSPAELLSLAEELEVETPVRCANRN